MKRVLITGTQSYIGKSLKKRLDALLGKYNYQMISLRDNSWKGYSFENYDAVVHIVGIAHIKETKNNSQKYYEINRDLAYEVAKKAKSEGVKQFLFLSSMSIYGLNEGLIDENTIPSPTTHYGKSKLQAENLLLNMRNNNFKVAILRPPIVYGKNSIGNYSKLAKLAKITPLFPSIDNKRSMIFIENLITVIIDILESNREGIFHPQNSEFVSTRELVALISKLNNKKIILFPWLNFLIDSSNNKTLTKVFGTLAYTKELSMYNEELHKRFISFEESIELTEGKND
ncbi:UDP-glucose 4-epimerase [Terribacillus saccharophilus]|uniref:UDP-glucose 4-epimerase n=1 Tax=Terribacillus saccharophilus TaxID=361277 RepID=A0AAX2EFH1_9BACI|nr:UDP-glucose 4-epimerase [Terribacillus saccharophilus]